MAETESIDDLFHVPGQEQLPEDVSKELESAMRLHQLSPQELFYKWESYCMKMGSENTTLNYDTARSFKTDIQESLEREVRSKNHVRGQDKKAIQATPRNAGNSDDVFGMMGVSTPAPRAAGAAKRKGQFETPSTKTPRSNLRSSPTGGKNEERKKSAGGGPPVASFVERTNAGEIIQSLNEHLGAWEPPIAPAAETRIKLTSNTEIKKFAYKPLAMHLSEASEVLDERIDDFLLMIQDHYKLGDDAFGNAAGESTHDTIAVGRVASDAPEGKPTEASLVLEMSRRMGAGRRIPLRFNPGVSGSFFPGQIVALKGKNSSGRYFVVSEILEVPLLYKSAKSAAEIEDVNDKLGVEDGEPSPSAALNVMLSCGPYTADDNLDYEPLHALCEKAQDSSADALILIGPFLDIEHPLIATGDFELPEEANVEPDHATLVDAFRAFVSAPISRLAHANPSIKIIMVPSVREAVNKHVAWPQQVLEKKLLGLPKQVAMVSNPVTISLNEIMIGISAADVLFDMRREEVNVGKIANNDLLARLPGHVIQQRHFFPMFPPADRSSLPQAGTEEGLATGTPMDISYLKLAEFGKVLPDALILPSALPSFAKVIEGVLVVNPGSLSKRRGPGQYSQMTIYPRKLTEEDRASTENLDVKLYERARVDIIRI